MKVKEPNKGMVTNPNTIEIDPRLCYLKTFDEKILLDAGFQIKKLNVRGETVLSDQKINSVNVLDDWSVTSTVSIRQRYNVPVITENFNKKLEGLLKLNPDATWSIQEMLLSRGKDRYLFKVAGNSTKRMLMREANGVGHDMTNIDEIMKEFADLFETQCFFKPGTSTLPMMCNPKQQHN